MLCEYLVKEHADYINNVKQLIEKGNLEILSGDHCEPLMSTIPNRDKVS